MERRGGKRLTGKAEIEEREGTPEGLKERKEVWKNGLGEMGRKKVNRESPNR